MNRYENRLEELEQYIEDCKMVPLSKNMIFADKELLLQDINGLRVETPDELKKYQKILNNRDSIINDAKEQADKILKFICYFISY